MLVTSTGDLGTVGNSLETSLGAVEATATGGIFFDNNRQLTIGGVSSTVRGLTAGGALKVVGNLLLNVNENVTANLGVELEALDGPDASANQLKLAANVKVESTTGDVALRSGDTFGFATGNKIVASGGSGQVTIATDWKNADPGVGGTFTLPTKAANAFSANRLVIVGDIDADAVVIPNLFLPQAAGSTAFAGSMITIEGSGGNDSVDVKLTDAPSIETRLTNRDVESVRFEHVTSEATDWVIDTDTQLTNTAFLSSGANRIIQNSHSVDAVYQTLDVRYLFGTGNDTLRTLQLGHPIQVDLKDGDDTVTVGGNRTVGTTLIPISPGLVTSALTLVGGVGNDRFVLEEPRTGDVVPIGRIDSTSTGSGLIADYGSRLSENPTSRIEFSTFENADINLGSTNSIFTVFDTVIKTTINSAAGDDVVNIRKLSAETIVNLGDGNDNLNIQGGGGNFLTVSAGENAETSSDLPGGGDRLRLGSTLTFDRNVINVADAPNAIKLFGNGFEPGQEVLFTSDGVAPGGLVSGTVYYAVPFGREVVRLAPTLQKALAASQTPSVSNNPNLVQITSGGTGNHQLTAATAGAPQWPILVGSLTGNDANPLLSYTQPGAERSVSVDAAGNRLTTLLPHGLVNNQQVAVFTNGKLPGGLRSEQFYFVVNATAGTFQLSNTASGTPIISPTNQALETSDNCHCSSPLSIA